MMGQAAFLRGMYGRLGDFDRARLAEVRQRFESTRALETLIGLGSRGSGSVPKTFFLVFHGAEGAAAPPRSARERYLLGTHIVPGFAVHSAITFHLGEFSDAVKGRPMGVG